MCHDDVGPGVPLPLEASLRLLRENPGEWNRRYEAGELGAEQLSADPKRVARLAARPPRPTRRVLTDPHYRRSYRAALARWRRGEMRMTMEVGDPQLDEHGAWTGSLARIDARSHDVVKISRRPVCAAVPRMRRRGAGRPGRRRRTAASSRTSSADPGDDPPKPWPPELPALAAPAPRTGRRAVGEPVVGGSGRGLR